jgi:hypothetical protein
MRYFFGFLIAISLIVLTFVLVLRGFRGNGTSVSTNINLQNYAYTSTEMQFTIDGPVTADQTHQGVTIDVGQYASTIQLYQGYQGDVTHSQTFNNNQDSYTVFLLALNLLGFTKGSSNPAVADSRGYCPQGERYIFDIVNNGNTTEHFWNTSCGGQGTFGGNEAGVESLFQAQIPNYGTIVENTAI